MVYLERCVADSLDSMGAPDSCSRTMNYLHSSQCPTELTPGGGVERAWLAPKSFVSPDCIANVALDLHQVCAAHHP